MKENSGTDETKKQIHKSVEVIWDKKIKTKQYSETKHVSSSDNSRFPEHYIPCRFLTMLTAVSK
jgi:hypothetical protein